MARRNILVNEWYHGTNESSAINICEKGIDFSKSKKELDFGPGFYLTDDEWIARKRAVQKTAIFNRIHKSCDKPAIVKVEVDTSVFSQISTKYFEFCNEEWLQFVLANRLSKTYLESHMNLEHNLYAKYDVVRGSIADSDISELTNHINNGDMELQDISVYDILTKSGKTLGEQLSLHTTESLKCVMSRTYNVIDGRRDK